MVITTMSDMSDIEGEEAEEAEEVEARPEICWTSYRYDDVTHSSGPDPGGSHVLGRYP